MAEEILVLSHTARIVPLLQARDAELVDALKKRGVYDADLIESNPPYLFRAEISNDLLDSHFTHMDEKTLRNYAEDSQRGVAFLKGHNWRELPIGYSMDALYEDTGSKKRTTADFYTIPGLTETNDLILRMRSGLVRDVSVGFHGGTMRCDICSNDFWECRHWPGIKYEVKEGDVVRNVIATYTIEDARLSEVSGVFDGSTPDAMILKAQRHAAQGLLTKKQVDVLEQAYRVRLNAKTFHVVGNPKERKMDEKQLIRAKEHLAASGIFVETDWDKLDEEGVLRGIQKISNRVKELEPEAEEGRQYRKDLIAEALAEGVRAGGNDFDKTTYQGVLERSPLNVIKRMRDDWKKVATITLPAGRSSVDDDRTPEKKVAETVEYPDEVYA